MNRGGCEIRLRNVGWVSPGMLWDCGWGGSQVGSRYGDIPWPSIAQTLDLQKIWRSSADDKELDKCTIYRISDYSWCHYTSEYVCVCMWMCVYVHVYCLCRARVNGHSSDIFLAVLHSVRAVTYLCGRFDLVSIAMLAQDVYRQSTGKGSLYNNHST